MNITKDMIIKHCIRCDATIQRNHFQDWLPILQAGSKTKITDKEPHIDLAYIREGLDCGTCLKNGIGETVIMVVFKWCSGE